MSFFQAIVLALVQGLTEFLPISSSAHLILVPLFLGWEDQGLLFDIATNTGTLAAVMLYFRRDLQQVFAALWSAKDEAVGPREIDGIPVHRFVAAWIVGTLPVAVAGWMWGDAVATVARNAWVILLTTVIFGLLLGLADRFGARQRDFASLRVSDAAWIGLAQAIALIPGTSRSGITITVALLVGLRRPAAARFSFLLAIPVGLLAAGWDAYQLLRGEMPGGEPLPLAVGFLVAGLAAYATIGWLLAWLERQNLSLFVAYRLALGAVIAVTLL
ncbi:MAG: undecaprenyl-diphosphate phosphatase [Acidobacteriota bacterium]